MTLIIASVHGEVPNELNGADLLEIRIDGLSPNQVAEQLPTLLENSPIPTIVTCRSAREGGVFEGEEDERVAMYLVALRCEHPPKYIDVEYETLSHHPLMLDTLASENTGVILSWHDVKSRPKDLLQRARMMQDVAGVDVVKMVWRARSIRDNIEAFELLKSKQQPMIALCMGEYGTMSRVLARKFGGFATYASIDGTPSTAPGQIHVKQLHSTYNIHSINKETKVYGVIGNNVAHSASPAFHNSVFQITNKNAVYIPLQVPEGWEHLKASFEELRNYSSLHFAGASITIPHKEMTMKLATTIDATCKRAGATNTITVEVDNVFAANTDVIALAELVQKSNDALVLGTGGVARAAIVALQQEGAKVSIVGRNVKKTKELAKEFSCSVVQDGDVSFDTIINCTPVGMQSGNDPNGNPLTQLAPLVSLGQGVHVIDTVYVPEKTPLLLNAIECGCRTSTGSEMFRLQATAQQQIWNE